MVISRPRAADLFRGTGHASSIVVLLAWDARE